jgi:hypothetical protein
MEQHIFAFSMIIEVTNAVTNGTAHFCIFNDYRGHHRKVVAICYAIYKQNIGFVEQKFFFELYRFAQKQLKLIN